MYMYIFARVKEIGLRQNTRVVNAHSCLSTTFSFSPMVLCSLVPNPHLPFQVFPLSRTSLIHNIIGYRAFLTFIIVKGKKNNNKKTKKKKHQQKQKKRKEKKKEINQNFRLKRLGKPQYIFIIFLFFSLPIYLAFSLT